MCQILCLYQKVHNLPEISSYAAGLFSVHYLNNRVFLSRDYRLIVAPRKFDVLKQIFAREAKLRGQIC